MSEQKLQLIHRFMKDISRFSSKEQLDAAAGSCAEELGINPSEPQKDLIYKLWKDAETLGRELVSLRAGSEARNALTEEEQAELAEVEQVISENRFDYHFQPIVNTLDGEIFSYEALMRPKSELQLRPYHVIKYSELTGRLGDIERATMLNVLGIVNGDRDKFKGRKVFINSIPNTRLRGEDLRHVSELLRKNCDTAVIEMTEQTEFDEYDFEEIKEYYRGMNVRIAIDDYGTGYSNVKNLLMYMPDFVKIDRSLISEIHNSPEKRHFVREIVEFCHDNDILALAEGVETAEELRSVILLGADLVQGFYTARPAAEVLDSIPYEIKQEIKRFRQERQDGRDQQIYSAEQMERVQLDRLIKEDYRCILIGKSAEGEGDVTVAGWPTLDTDMHIEIARGFKGRLTLENARLSNVKGRPCIDICEDCDVTLFLIGESRLNKSGIRVHESARLTVEGEGRLNIKLDDADGFGIGNDLGSKHGELIFNQNGCIQIDANCTTAVGIGSGMSGKLSVLQGQYVLNINGEMGVAIGSFYSDCELELCSCDINADMSVSKGAAIGSMSCSSDIRICKASVKIYMGGNEMAAIGTVSGDSSTLNFHDANVIINITGERCTCSGALDGSTDLKVDKAGFRVTANGRKILPFGGFTSDTKVSLTDADTIVKLLTEADFRDYLPEKGCRISGGRARFLLNEYEAEIKTVDN